MLRDDPPAVAVDLERHQGVIETVVCYLPSNPFHKPIQTCWILEIGYGAEGLKAHWHALQPESSMV